MLWQLRSLTLQLEVAAIHAVVPALKSLVLLRQLELMSHDELEMDGPGAALDPADLAALAGAIAGLGLLQVLGLYSLLLGASESCVAFFEACASLTGLQALSLRRCYCNSPDELEHLAGALRRMPQLRLLDLQENDLEPSCVAQVLIPTLGTMPQLRAVMLAENDQVRSSTHCGADPSAGGTPADTLHVACTTKSASNNHRCKL